MKSNSEYAKGMLSELLEKILIVKKNNPIDNDTKKIFLILLWYKYYFYLYQYLFNKAKVSKLAMASTVLQSY
jgi:hypothetical protein